MPAPEPGMERLISSITEAVAAGFREATKQQFEDLRRSLGVLNVTLESMTKGLDVIKENQNDRKVKFALMESRLGEVEKDIAKNDAEKHVKDMCEKLLANTVIESYRIEL